MMYFVSYKDYGQPHRHRYSLYFRKDSNQVPPKCKTHIHGPAICCVIHKLYKSCFLLNIKNIHRPFLHLKIKSAASLKPFQSTVDSGKKA
jgi:hypothetical protein